ncbi:MAG: DUF1565 domain-containing protein, partial [Akkermansiaceae bacterium]|nr:DUF1565 domain-containing protein [Akkermansiaceae bacterium]
MLLAVLAHAGMAAAGETFETGKAPAVEVHVAVAGHDGTGDGSAGNPYRTIGRGVQAARAGTAVRIHPGIYRGGTRVADLAGTAEKPIWIGGVPGAERPVIEGGAAGLHLTRVRFLVVHDMEVRKARHNGINCDDGGACDDPEATRHVVFRGLFIHDVGGTGNQDGLK